MVRAKGNSTVFNYEGLYRECRASVVNYILRQGGQRDDAEDVFQEGLLVLLDKEHGEFHLTSSPKTYLFAICKNIWLKKQRGGARFVPLKEGIWETEELGISEETEHSLLGRIRVVLRRVSAHCYRMIHDLFYRGKDIDDIQTEYGYTTRQNAINQKYKCMNQLKKASKTLKSNSAG